MRKRRRNLIVLLCCAAGAAALAGATLPDTRSDSTAPQVSLTLDQSLNEHVLQWTATDDAGNGGISYSLQQRTRAYPAKEYSPPSSVLAETSQTSDTVLAAWGSSLCFRVVAKDAAGNQQASPERCSESRPPTPPILELKQRKRVHMLDWTEPEDHLRFNVRRMQRRYPSRKFSAPTNARTTTDASSGRWRTRMLTTSCFAVQAIDTSGNTSDWGTYRCGDMVPPTVAVPLVSKGAKPGTVVVRMSGSDTASGIYGFLPQYTVTSQGSSSTPRVLSLRRQRSRTIRVPQTNGLLCFAARSVDTNGNVSSPSAARCLGIG